MRASLLKTFDKIFVVDLHGNANKKEAGLDGLPDENVFDIRQGVSIIVAVKTSNFEEWAEVNHVELIGCRLEKFEQLATGSFEFSELTPDPGNLFLVPQSVHGKVEYESGVAIADLFPVNAIGMMAMRDTLAVDMTREAMEKKVKAIISSSEKDLRAEYDVGKDSRDWKYKYAKDDLTQNYPNKGTFIEVNYRPFDKRWTFYTGTTKGLMAYPRYQVMRHFLKLSKELPTANNVGLAFPKGTVFDMEWDGISVVDSPVNGHFIDYPTRSVAYVAPLYLCPEGMETEWKANLNERELGRLVGNLSIKPEPLQVFDYIYGVLYDPKYREKYGEFLKRDYPRVPIVGDPEAATNPDAFYVSEERFWQYVDAGSRLRKLHLLEDKHPADLTIEPKDSNDLEIGAISYKNGILHLNKKKTIKGIPEEAYNYYIGGYQVLPKWFKSHKGGLLDIKNFSHIQNVVGALVETIKIQKEFVAFARKER